MRVFTKYLFIIIFLFPAVAYSQTNITIAGSCFHVLTLGIDKLAPCDPTLPTFPSSPQPAYGDGTNPCTYNVSDQDGCMIVHNVCCTLQPDNYGDDNSSKVSVTGVTAGGESAAAEAAFNSWVASATVPAAPSGYVSTGYFSGYAYESVYDYGTNTSTVYMYPWIRSVNKYSALASSAVGGVGGTGGGGTGGGGTGGGTGITGTDVENALNSSLGVGGTGASGIGDSVGNTLNNLFGSGSGYGSGSITAPSSGTGSGTAGANNTFGTAYQGKNTDGSNKSNSSSIGTRFNSFVTTVKTSSLFSLHTNLMGNVPTTGTPTLTISAGTYGNHTVDFSNTAWASVLAVLKTIILLIFAFVSVRVLVLKH